MENNQTVEALLAEIKSLNQTVVEIKNLHQKEIVEISKNLETLVKATEEREKRFAERGARPQGGDRGGFRSRSDRGGDSSWGNNSGGFGGRGRDDRDRNKG